MFDLDKKPDEPFAFDLEAEMKEDPEKANAMLDDVHERMNELKNMLRAGAETDDFDEYGVLLHGYAALERVLKRINRNK
jgi:hypothetical protein